MPPGEGVEGGIGGKADHDAPGDAVTAHSRHHRQAALDRLCCRLGMHARAAPVWAARTEHPVFCIALFIVASVALKVYCVATYIVGAPGHLEYGVPCALLLAFSVAMDLHVWQQGPVDSKPTMRALADQAMVYLMVYR
jgi:hypothetical protein